MDQVRISHEFFQILDCNQMRVLAALSGEEKQSNIKDEAVIYYYTHKNGNETADLIKWEVENVRKKLTRDVGLSRLWISGGRWLLLWWRWIVGDALKRRRRLLVIMFRPHWSVFAVFYAARHLSLSLSDQ